MRSPVLFLAAVLTAASLSAAPDTVDGVFAGSAGTVFDAAEYGGVSSLIVQPDGKVIFGGNEAPGVIHRGTPMAEALAMPLIRFQADGTFDNSFFADNEANGSDSGIFYDDPGWPEVHALGLLSDGRIVAAGVMQGVRTGTVAAPGTFLRSNSIVRFNADGTIDTGFQTAGTTGWPTGGFNYIEEVTIQPDDKILAVGGFGGFRDSQVSPTVTRYGIARLNVDGSLDTTFHVDPSEFGAPAGATALRGYFSNAVVDPSGKIYVTGSFEWGTSFPYPNVLVCARLFPDGRRDFSFQPTLPSNLLDVRGIELEPDGRVVVLGQYESPATSTWMARLNPDGSNAPGFTLDPSLGVVTARPLRRDPSGKYLLATSSGANQDTLVRILPNGSLDPSFQATSLWTDHPTSTPQAGYFGTFVTAPDGTIYSGSAFDSVNGVPTVKVVAFDGDAVPAGLAWSATAPTVVENAGSITLSVVRTGPSTGAASVDFSTSAGSAGAGDFSAVSGTLNWPAGTGGAKTVTIPITQDSAAEGNETFAISLANASGAPVGGPASINVTIQDDEDLPVITSQPVSVTVKQGEPAMFSVTVSSPVPATYQWTRNGDDIPGATAAIYQISAAVPADEAVYRVVVTTPAGDVTSDPAQLTVIPPAALVDSSFSFSGVAKPGSFAILTDGSVLMLDGDAFNGYTLRKFDASFDVDPSFSVTTVPSSGFPASSVYPSPIALPNGQFLARGFFSEINGVTRKFLARLDADGTVDASFVPFFNGTFQVNGFNTSISSLTGLAITETGKVYVMVKTASQGTRLFRMMSDGSIDTTFNHTFEYSTNGQLNGLAELPDGSIITAYSSGFGSVQRGIRRILPDGTIDPDFNAVTTAFPAITGIVLLPGDRFAALHGSLLEIYSIDGTLLETFTFGGSITSMQPFRGRYLITGVTSFDGVDLPGLALFDLDGTVDDNFPGGAGPNANVTQVGVDGDGRILVVGGFTTWNGVAAPGFTRLLVDRPEIAFATPLVKISEDGGALAVGLVRYGNTDEAASVRVTTSDGTAAAPGDFIAIDQVVSWPAGDDSEKFVSLVPENDSDIEGDETLTITLVDPVATATAVATMHVTLRDDDSLPTISSQPLDVFGVLGKPAYFTVSATSPTAMTYQWYLDGVVISGATAATLNIASVSATDEGTYTVRITNDYDTIVSDPADLLIIPDPAAIASGFSATPLGALAYTLAPAPDGGVYVGGAFINAGGDPNRDYLVKLNANGSLDTSFNPPLLNGAVRDLAVQPDGKIIAAGQFTTVAGASLRRILRVDATGALDPAFTTNVGAGPNGDVLAVELEPDGRVIIGGGFSTWNNISLGGKDDLLRLNSDGTIATNVVSDFATQILDVQSLPDGDLLVSYNTTSSSAAKVRRFNADLTLDNSLTYASGRTKVERMTLASDGNFLFAGPNGLFKVDAAGGILTTFPSSGYFALARQVNGKVIAGGSFASRLFRYLPDGTADPSFTLATNPNGNVYSIALRGDGSFWVGGAFTSINGTTVNYVALFNGDPIPLAITSQPAALTVVDPGDNISLNVGATGMTTLSYQWFLDGDPLSDGPGVSGSQSATLSLSTVDDADGGDYTVAVTNEAGTETSSVAKVIVLGAPQILSLSDDVSQLEGGPLVLEVEALGAGTLSYQWYRGPTLLPSQTSATLDITPSSESDSGNYTVVITNTLGSATSDPIAVEILGNPAAIASGFVPPTANGTVRAILPLEDGKALVGGDFTSVTDGTTNSGTRLAVVDANGAVVSVPNLSADGSVYAIRRDSNGKILLAGSFNNVNGSLRRRSARLNADLTLDTSYDPSSVVDPGQFIGAAIDIAEEASGTILLVGQFADYAGNTAADYAVRLSDTGALLPSFTSGASSYVYRVLPQADGKAIFLGWFGWGSNSYVVRTLADGAPDGTTFAAAPAFGNDGFYLGDGAFLASSAFSAATYRYINTGALDSSFLSLGQPNGTVTAFARDADGRFLLGGNFTAIAGQSKNRVARVKADGTFDANFDAGAGFNSSVEDIAIAPDGSIWAGGAFTSYNNVTANRLVRLKGNPVSTPADPFATFVAGLPANLQGENDDADGDGIVNLIEFLFGTDPGDPAAAPSPVSFGSNSTGASLNSSYGLVLDPAKSYRVIEVVVPTERMGLSVDLEASQDLNFNGDANATQLGSPVVNGAMETRSYFLTPAVEDASALFWRLKVLR
ncbi:MAG: immunoglobulin domain-containing protein [Verrucomicrobiae bacterium]|nr:immunoglobulin domain-containing protein [Verrucomicrobiae bacterium]